MKEESAVFLRQLAENIHYSERYIECLRQRPLSFILSL